MIERGLLQEVYGGVVAAVMLLAFCETSVIFHCVNVSKYAEYSYAQIAARKATLEVAKSTEVPGEG